MKRKRLYYIRRKKSIAVLAAIAAAIAVAVLAVVICRELARSTALNVVKDAAGTAPPSVSAEGAVLCDRRTGEIIFEKNGRGRLYPASTTKIMTALVTLETLDELGLTTKSCIVVPPETVGVEGSSIFLKAGERVSIDELLYGLMLRSGNDSAETLAACIGGERDVFIDRMNRTAERLGCKDTHFTNPSGLPDENHYTTAADLAKISIAAMQREDFREIVKAKSWKNEDGTKNYVNKNKTVFNYEGGDGVKIGFTKKSGRTLVASASRDDVSLLAVVLNDGNWFADAYRLMDYGFAVCGAGES